MKELCQFEAIVIGCFRMAVELGMGFSYMDTHYDPRDFAYWGA